MPTPTACTMYLFGATAFTIGLNVLLVDPLSSPSSSSSSSSSPSSSPPSSFSPPPLLPEICRPATNGNALAAIAMGLYYTLAAWQENSAFFALSVPMRLLTAAVFWAQGWEAPAAWEGTGALLTAGALVLERAGSGAGGGGWGVWEDRGRTRTRTRVMSR